MAITIQGIKVEDIQLQPDKDNGGYRIHTALYHLISSTGKILAKQTIGGYQGVALEPSPETKKALEAFTSSYTKDVQNILGLLE